MLRWRRGVPPACLCVLGLIWAAAHALAHDLASHPLGGRHGTGHGNTLETYVAHLPTSLALCLILAAAVATGVTLGNQWAYRFGGSIWLFGIVPVVGFAGHTFAERAAYEPAAGLTAALLEVFLIGLLVQVPIALVAIGLAGRIASIAARLPWPVRGSQIPGLPDVLTGLAWTQAGEGRQLHLAGSRLPRAPPLALDA
jgi:hypothetical protein